VNVALSAIWPNPDAWITFVVAPVLRGSTLAFPFRVLAICYSG